MRKKAIVNLMLTLAASALFVTGCGGGDSGEGDKKTSSSGGYPTCR